MIQELLTELDSFYYEQSKEGEKEVVEYDI
jgi:hypothetical protein